MDKPAFPLARSMVTDTGLTRRELFAAMALQGLVGSAAVHSAVGDATADGSALPVDVVAAMAILHADALIEELDK